MISSAKALLATATLAVTAGCTTGTSYVETLATQINAPDAIAVTAIGLALYQLSNGSVWEAQTTPVAADRYRIVLKRALLASGGEGEAGRIFRQHAQTLTAAHPCPGYRILHYEERLDARLIGAQRIAEGTIECVKT
jgi:hypothetical protein